MLTLILSKQIVQTGAGFIMTHHLSPVLLRVDLKVTFILLSDFGNKVEGIVASPQKIDRIVPLFRFEFFDKILGLISVL